MSEAALQVSAEWLALRESADAAARAGDLAEQLARRLTANDGIVVHDLGGGTGSMGRWLAPLLPGAQHWVIHERDEDLLAVAADRPPDPAADGAAVTVAPTRSDIFRLTPGDLAGAGLITASALLDMLTEDELATLVAICAGLGCPVLLTLSVVGRVELAPADPLDHRITAAFNAHQRRMTERGALLGPDAAACATEAFGQWGGEVFVRDTPWQLGAGHAALVREWLHGWVGAACEQEPALAAETTAYARRRLAQLASGRLAVMVGHADLLIVPATSQPH